MADAVKEKEGFYDSIYKSAVSRDGYSGETLPSSIWQSFKLMFSGKFTLILKISIINLIFCLPIIAWSIVISYIAQPVSGTVPYSSNIGVGYPFVDNAIQIGHYLNYVNAMLYYGVMTACIVIACIGVGAMFCIVRKILWGEPVKIFGDFIEGLKNTWVASLIGGILSAGGFMLMMMNLYVYDAYALATTGKVFGIMGSIIVFAFLCVYSVYLVSLSATYKMKLHELLISALKLTVGRAFPNLMMVVFSAWVGILCWVIGEYLNSFAIFVYALLFIFGIYYCVAVCTVNTHRQFDRFINTISDKNTVAVVYGSKKTSDGEKTEKTEAKKKPVHYVNPKKGKKKTDEPGAPRLTPSVAPKMPDNIKGGEHGLDDDLSVYVDDEE